MKVLEKLRGKDRSAEVNQRNLAAMMNWMRIGLDNIQVIEAQAKELKGRIVNGKEGAAGLGKITIIEAGRLALIDREQDRLFENSPQAIGACIGMKVKITPLESEIGVARFYDGDDYRLDAQDAVITGTIDGLYIVDNGLIGDGAVELVRATSTIHPERAPSSRTSPVSVHHMFSQYPSGMYRPAVSLELV